MTKTETLSVILFGGIALIVCVTGLLLIAASLFLPGALVLEH
jgi:hypothetical protein